MDHDEPGPQEVAVAGAPSVSTWQVFRAERRAANAGVGAWLQGHPHLRAVEAEAGEPAVALLILWEVDHGRQWPSEAPAED